MPVSLNTVLGLIQTFNASLSGVNNAPLTGLEYPRNEIPRGELPTALAYPEDGEWSHPRLGSCPSDSRVWIVRYYVADTNTEIGNQVLTQINDLIDEVGLGLLDQTNVINSGETNVCILYNEPITDTGYTENMFYLDKPYHGFEFSFTVERKLI